MLVTIKPGRAGFAIYAISRDENAFVILEGDPLRAETIANMLLAEHQYSHMSFAISFKEENLNLEQIQEIYEEWKKKFFSNYTKDELEIFSVVHFDDQKPHIHCSVMQYSMENDKDLRLFRGRPDFPRNEAVTELINYQFGLASHFDNIGLFKLTKTQKKRDWKVKKGSRFYFVEDDEIYTTIEKEAKEAKNFNDFVSRLKEIYPLVTVYNQSQNYLGETTLALSPEKKFTSFLFNEKWFNRNIDSLRKRDFSKVKISLKRKTQNQYEKIYQETTEKHLKHLSKRKVGKENYRKEMMKKVLSAIANEEPLYTHEDAWKMEEDIAIVLKGAGADVFFEDEEKIEYSFNGKRFTHKKILPFLLKENEDDTKAVKIKLQAYDLSKYLEKNKFVEELIDFCLKGNIRHGKDFATLLEELHIRIGGVGEDIKRGRYVKISKNKGKNIYLYNDFLAAIADLTPERLEELEKIKKNKLEELKGRFLKTYLNTVASSALFNNTSPASCIEYQIHNSPLLNFSVKGDKKTKILTRREQGRAHDIIIDSGDHLQLSKSLDFEKSVESMLEMIRIKGWKSISIDKSSTLYHRLLAEIIKKEIPLVVKDERNGNIVYDGTKKKQVEAKAYFDTLFEDPEMDVFISSLLATEPTSRKNKEAIRLMIEEFAKRTSDPLLLKSLLETLGYKLIRAGEDPKKGKYLTIEKNGQKLALYNPTAADVLLPQKGISQKDISLLSFVNKQTKSNQTIDEFYKKKKLLEALYNLALPDMFKADIFIASEYTGGHRSITFRQKDSEIIDKGESIEVVKTKDMASAASDVLKIAQMKGTPYLDTDNSEFAYLLAQHAIKTKSKIEIRSKGLVVYSPDNPDKEAKTTPSLK